MTSSWFKRIIRRTVAEVAILAAFLVPQLGAQQPEHVTCRESLKSMSFDKSMNPHWEGNTLVVKVRGVEYVCRCVSPSARKLPDCKPRNSSGAGGLSGVDLSQFNPGQQLALKATESLIQGLFKSIFSEDKPAGSAEDALKQQQDMLRKQEEERAQALERWNLYQKEEKERALREQEEARKSGQELLAKIGGAGGQGLNFQSISGEKLEFDEGVARKPEANPLPSGKYPAPKTAVEQARCAAYFSDKALELSKLGKNEEAKFMSLQAQKAMSGEPLDVPCQAATAGAGAGSGPDSQKADSQAMGISEILNQYNAKIKELLEISQQLAEVRKQKIEAECDVREVDARIMDIKSRAASVTQPEEKQQLDDLLNKAMALRGESEARLKIAEENENSYLTNARQVEYQVKELNSKLKEGKDKK